MRDNLHISFQRRANTHNDNVCREIKAKFENNMRKRIGRNYLNNNDFINLFLSQKQDSLNEVYYVLILLLGN